MTQLFSSCYLRNNSQATACRQLSSRRLLSLLKEGAVQTVFDYLLIEVSGKLCLRPFTWPLFLLLHPVCSIDGYSMLLRMVIHDRSHGRDNPPLQCLPSSEDGA